VVSVAYLVNEANLHDVSPPVKRRTGQHHGDLPAALLSAGLDLVRESGPRGFTMAEAARRAGVSVAAPYKHFADREALLVALAVQGYEEQERRFTAAVSEAVPPADQLVAVAQAYVDFAVQQRALFEVVFGAGLDKGRHPALATAGAQVLRLLLPPAEALRPGDGEALLVSVAALAHGYAVFLLEGTLGPPASAVGVARARLEDDVRRLLG
jgi:AcrR family transcriptional regulator